ncbi:MAG: ATP-binding protein [Syntrophales bacterium]
MLELSMHILDIVENSTRAGAGLVKIKITEDPDRDSLSIEIDDDGAGMDDGTLRGALDPFFTTKQVRRVGLGLPMLQQAARQADGHLEIVSKPGDGTRVKAQFRYGHIDRQPLGDIAGTMVSLITSNPDVDFVYRHENRGRVYALDTRDIKKEIGDVPVDHPEIIKLIREDIEKGLKEIGTKKS